jgi:hypothetical protein
MAVCTCMRMTIDNTVDEARQRPVACFSRPASVGLLQSRHGTVMYGMSQDTASVAGLSLTRQSATNRCGVTMPLGDDAQQAHMPGSHVPEWHVAEWHVAEWHVVEWHVPECQHASMPARLQRLAARLEGERRGRGEGEERVRRG